MKAAILGCGSWGTALAILLARNSHDVVLAGRSEEEIEILRSHRENLKYLPGFIVPSDVRFETLHDFNETADLIVVAVPSGAVREVIQSLKDKESTVVICSKGLEVGTALLMTQVVEQICPSRMTGVLSGPNLALEIVRGIPTVAISAFSHRTVAERVQSAFIYSTFRVSVSDDVVGIELGGALKNVLAIGAGMADGLGFGDNTKGAFLSRGLMEMARLGAAMGARPETFLGPAGVGDLFATANSHLSRNYRLGKALGEGKALKQSQIELGQVSEGVPTSEATQMLARKHQVEMPVFAAVEAVIRERIQPSQAVAMLMDRATKMDDFLSERPSEA